MKIPYQKALITGASAGLGEEYARQLAAAGTDLILVARRKDRLEKLAAELKEKFRISAEVFPADLSREEEIYRLADKIRQTEDLDLLINNAGFGGRSKFYRDETGEAEKMIGVHVTAPVVLTRAALAAMIKKNRGAVINLASVAAFSPFSGAMYSSTKAFLVMFSENLQNELMETGIKIQALCPGLTHTEFHQVAGIKKETIPGLLWMKADRVVRISLKALNGRKVMVVPGCRNRIIAFLMRCPWTFSLLRWLARLDKIRKVASLKEEESEPAKEGS
ncbi:MAG: SDR family oxidoreductase [Candidatus Saccharicenans sp.]|jgi:short-subunit dehydrogenase|nr:SDR family oxidoreductase [Candidatus Saccharicenans sp.]MDH7493525.1 SDR family oxidoreductase [Candidatus Saccharicenans sp.]